MNQQDLKELLREAARLLGEFYSFSKLSDTGRKFDYTHEVEGLAWLRGQCERDPETVLCAWTHSRIRELQERAAPRNEELQK